MNRNIPPMNAATLIVRCPVCSDEFRLTPEDVRLDVAFNVYRFDCERCGSVCRPANRRLVTLLRAAGALDVDAISEAEVDRFVVWLDSTDCLVEWL